MNLNRRDFLKILGTASTASLLGCSPEQPQKLIPYLIPPDEAIPGVAIWYATVCRECPAGCGMLVRTREGRAVKVEGNPAHPVSRGGLCARGQASLQGLYNPDRIRQPLRREASGKFQSISWGEAEERLAGSLRELRRPGRGSQIVFLTERITGSLDRLVDEWLAALGSRRRLAYEPFAHESLSAANGITFGQREIPRFAIEQADFLVSFGADFLETWISPVEFSRAFAEMRAPGSGRQGAFVYIGPRLSLTAANADEWVAIKPGTEVFLALGMIHVILHDGLARRLSLDEESQLKALVRAYDPTSVAARSEVSAERIVRLARAFAGANPSLALGGGVPASGRNATATLVAINLLNYVAGNIGETVRFVSGEQEREIATFQEMKALVTDMAAGGVAALFLHNVNPAFTLPPKVGFEAALQRVPLKVSFSSFMDETTALADLILPDHTPLESWGDYAPYAGVHGLLQPVMRPVFETKAMGDVLLAVAKAVDEEVAGALPWGSSYDYLRDQWKRAVAGSNGEGFEELWDEALRKGGRWEETPSKPVRLSPAAFEIAFEDARFDGPGDGSLVLLPFPSMSHFDGRGANRPWLQELPDPMTKITWDSWVEMNPETARRQGIKEGDVITVASSHGAVEFPAHLYEGVRRDAVAIPIGQGHRAYGRYAEGRGANPIELLPAEAEVLSGGLPWLATRVSIMKTGRRVRHASTAGHPQQLGREIAQVIPLAELGRGGVARGESSERRRSMEMYGDPEYPEHRWGMSIDLNACIGCSACMVACSAENNIPVVGKEQVVQGREMSWIRIERYFEGDSDRPDTRFLPMLCQQCGKAPCEPVCPVYATYHTPEGLNAQVYNRCVGTRYCSNNCPYKVRRFNWFTYEWPEPLNWQLNPDVSVREMGVMEKCTFCVQRIRGGKDRAKDEGRPVRDGEIVPACAQSCPTQAIVFGDLKDPGSQVSKLTADVRGYHVLGELNTKPAITYLRKVSRKPTAG